MCQRKYALEAISESGLGGARPAGTPLEVNQKLTSEEYDRCIKGSEEHADKLLKDPGALRVVRYLKEAAGLGLLMPTQNSNKLSAYCDSDWGACLQTRRSVTGYLVKFGDALISWKSKK
ncbi:PREDICTED: uncharacterized protein LOC109210045 [Nicotiana attenuata]|uniref:uncharacterized protein LOC109210045 n=1 Tax=Nicotiana attenuata TaxID=49451 RepID=UPI00090549CD|nr:PREDICTED: uncharacterized protein LOC109210045 [Nicotiana attenuata]